MGQQQEISKFGFGYEPLSQSIDELELTKEDSYTSMMFQKAKDELKSGNEIESENILRQMFDNGEIRYKHLSAFGSNLLMSTFAPISDIN